MQVKIETPPTGEGTPERQLSVLQSYLHRTAQQLQWAFDMLDADAPAAQALPESPVSQNRDLTPQEKFAEIKNLIIRSADIVNAYSEKIQKKLDGAYVAKSRFGTFQEKTSQQLQADSKGIRQLFTHQQTIARQLQDLTEETAATRAYIRTGCLKEGKTPVYGLEIGQRSTVNGREVFRKYARFTADRLSFFDASDVEVAYVSDFKLYITNAQVAGELTIGARFCVSFDGGLIFKWTGGDT